MRFTTILTLLLCGACAEPAAAPEFESGAHAVWKSGMSDADLSAGGELWVERDGAWKLPLDHDSRVSLKLDSAAVPVITSAGGKLELRSPADGTFEVELAAGTYTLSLTDVDRPTWLVVTVIPRRSKQPQARPTTVRFDAWLPEETEHNYGFVLDRATTVRITVRRPGQVSTDPCRGAFVSVFGDGAWDEGRCEPLEMRLEAGAYQAAVWTADGWDDNYELRFDFPGRAPEVSRLGDTPGEPIDDGWQDWEDDWEDDC